jgi:hypothetical protein
MLKRNRPLEQKALKAYHQVFGEGALERVLEDGAILPGIYRLDPDWVESRCEESLAKMIRSSPGDVLGAGAAIRAQADYAISDIRKFQEILGASGFAQPTQLECIDIMFGDSYRIFLSMGEFRFGGPQTGFVYDAYDLVKRGAVIREEDFMGEYEMILNRVISGRGDHLEISDPAERLQRLVADLQETESSSTGDLARLSVNKDAASRAEIVWEGPLPIEWALEVWREGVRMR